MKLKGTFSPPGDKSISHRIGLLSLLAQGRTRVGNYSTCEDCQTTLKLVEALGGLVERQGEDVVLHGLGRRLNPQSIDLDCGNSGTTMRLIMGLLAGLPGEYNLDGDGSLRKRPMERVATPLRQMGGQVETADGTPPVKITGGELSGISYTLPVASAQLKSAILLAGVQAGGSTTVVEPIKTRDHTEHMLRLCGAKLERSRGAWTVERADLTLPDNFWVPGDISSAAFFLCGAAMTAGGDVTAERILLNASRTGMLDVLSRMGARVEEEIQGDVPEAWGRVRVRYSPDLKGCEVTHAEIPLLVDEVPVLALLATQAEGDTVFRQVGELRVKESDRLNAIITQLNIMGADISIEGDDLLISGPTPLKAVAGLDSFGDHRIAMMLKIAGVVAGRETAVAQEECASISYPNFYQDLRALLR
jgi:3-phosphoshikimate 1-carboxyvinyltransferase